MEEGVSNMPTQQHAHGACMGGVRASTMAAILWLQRVSPAERRQLLRDIPATPPASSLAAVPTGSAAATAGPHSHHTHLHLRLPTFLPLCLQTNKTTRCLQRRPWRPLLLPAPHLTGFGQAPMLAVEVLQH